MQIRTLAELTTADDRSLRFTPLGLATGGRLSPETATEFQQGSVASADLVPAVPEDTRNSFERLRRLHAYGVLFYDAFTLAEDLTWVVLEQALRRRFIDFYGGSIPVVSKTGAVSNIVASDSEALREALRPGGSHGKGWRLRPKTGKSPIPVPRTLRQLLRWARREQLLHGQRNRRSEEGLFGEIRNRFAHGTYFRIGMPNESARAICDLAEIVNRLWGELTPGGRLYPAPVQRDILVVGWSSGWAAGVQGSSLTVVRAEQLDSYPDHGERQYLVVLGVWNDDQFSEFDNRYELTKYPASLLWGPGSRKDALTWLEKTTPVGDEVSYLDRLFGVRRHEGKVYLPRRPEVLLGLPEDHRDGTWHLVRADFPQDAFAHVRDVQTDGRQRDQRYGGGAIDEIEEGRWEDVAAAIMRLQPDIQPARYSDAHVPRRWRLPDSVGS